MESIAVIQPNMGVLSRDTLPVTPFGALAQTFAEEILARAQREEGRWSYVPLDLLEEGEQFPQASQPPVIQVDLKLVLEALRREQSKSEQRQAAQRIVERILQIREIRQERSRDSAQAARRQETPRLEGDVLHQQIVHNLYQENRFAPVLLSLERGAREGGGTPAALYGPGSLGRQSVTFFQKLQQLRERGERVSQPPDSPQGENRTLVGGQARPPRPHGGPTSGGQPLARSVSRTDRGVPGEELAHLEEDGEQKARTPGAAPVSQRALEGIARQAAEQLRRELTQGGAHAPARNIREGWENPGQEARGTGAQAEGPKKPVPGRRDAPAEVAPSGEHASHRGERDTAKAPMAAPQREGGSDPAAPAAAQAGTASRESKETGPRAPETRDGQERWGSAPEAKAAQGHLEEKKSGQDRSAAGAPERQPQVRGLETVGPVETVARDLRMGGPGGETLTSSSPSQGAGTQDGTGVPGWIPGPELSYRADAPEEAQAGMSPHGPREGRQTRREPAQSGPEARRMARSPAVGTEPGKPGESREPDAGKNVGTTATPLGHKGGEHAGTAAPFTGESLGVAQDIRTLSEPDMVGGRKIISTPPEGTVSPDHSPEGGGQATWLPGPELAHRPVEEQNGVQESPAAAGEPVGTREGKTREAAHPGRRIETGSSQGGPTGTAAQAGYTPRSGEQEPLRGQPQAVQGERESRTRGGAIQTARDIRTAPQIQTAAGTPVPPDGGGLGVPPGTNPGGIPAKGRLPGTGETALQGLPFGVKLTHPAQEERAPETSGRRPSPKQEGAGPASKGAPKTAGGGGLGSQEKTASSRERGETSKAKGGFSPARLPLTGQKPLGRGTGALGVLRQITGAGQAYTAGGLPQDQGPYLTTVPVPRSGPGEPGGGPGAHRTAERQRSGGPAPGGELIYASTSDGEGREREEHPGLSPRMSRTAGGEVLTETGARPGRNGSAGGPPLPGSPVPGSAFPVPPQRPAQAAMGHTPSPGGTPDGAFAPRLVHLTGKGAVRTPARDIRVTQGTLPLTAGLGLAERENLSPMDRPAAMELPIPSAQEQGKKENTNAWPAARGEAGRQEGDTPRGAEPFRKGRPGMGVGPEPVELAYGPSNPEGAGAGEAAEDNGPPAESEYVRKLPDWARRFLRDGPGKEGQSMASARNIATLPQPAAEETVRWQAPNYRPPAAPMAYRERRQEEPRQNAAPRISETELQRTADRVYRMIEDRIRRERRRLGL